MFTGWVLPIDQYLKEFSREKLINLFKLLDRYSKTQFVIYMEFKLKDESTVYLHFHVVTGSVGDIHQVQALWRRKVCYEYPIVSDDALLQYIRKYASKSPIFQSPSQQRDYVALTYKLQMCRYSVRKDPDFTKIKACCWPVPVLVGELQRGLQRHRPTDEWGTARDYIPYLDDPPSPESDIPACVKVYEERPDSWHPEPIDWSVHDYIDEPSPPLVKINHDSTEQQEREQIQNNKFQKAYEERDKAFIKRLKRAIDDTNTKYQ